MVKRNALIWIVPVLLLSGCGDSGPDYTPFGDGMKAIAICLVVAAVVRALADLAVNESDKSSKDREAKRKHQRQDQSKGGEQ